MKKGSSAWAWGTIFIFIGVILLVASLVVVPLSGLPGSEVSPYPSGRAFSTQSLLASASSYEFPLDFYVETNKMSPTAMSISQPDTDVFTNTVKNGLYYEISYVYKTELTEDEYLALAGNTDVVGIWEPARPVLIDGTYGNLAGALQSSKAGLLVLQGITGNGVIVAIIDDFPPQSQFYDYFPSSESDRILHYPSSSYTSTSAKHGVMTSCIVNDVAPDCLFYFMDFDEGIYESFDKLLDLKEQYPSFDIVCSNSYSFMPQYDEYNNPNNYFNQKVLECAQNDIIVLFAVGNWAHEGEHTSSWTYEVGFDSRAQYFNRDNEIGYPAVFNSVISVAGCTYDNEYILSYSSLGRGIGGFDEPDISAPTHYEHNNPYGYAGGTSAACPFMAGICALILDGNNTADTSRMVDAIHGNAVDRGDVGFDDEFGYGVVDAMLLYQNYNNWIPPDPEGASPILLLSGVGLIGVGIVFRRKDEIDWSMN